MILSGSEEATRRAKDIIEELTQGDFGNRGGGFGGGGGGGFGRGNSGSSVNIYVESSKVGKIIGNSLIILIPCFPILVVQTWKNS